MARIRSVRNSLAVFIAVLAGCATASLEEQLGEARQSWEGASYEDVVARWGPPARSTQAEQATETHTWVSQEVPVRPYGPSVGVGVFGSSGGRGGVGVGVGFPIGGTVNPATCERTLTFKERRLVEQHWTGDPAYCRYFKRAT